MSQTVMTPNIAALLATISHSEGTDRPPAPLDPYRCCYAFKHVIVSLADHPALTGEWNGESLTNLGQAYAGMVSTAAGKYQLTKHTWMACKAALSLPDFGPACQDAAACLLIQQRGGIALVNNGKFEDAIARCASIWASLPGSLSGQPQKPIAALVQFYTDVGGVVA